MFALTALAVCPQFCFLCPVWVEGNSRSCCSRNCDIDDTTDVVLVMLGLVVIVCMLESKPGVLNCGVECDDVVTEDYEQQQKRRKLLNGVSAANLSPCCSKRFFTLFSFYALPLPPGSGEALSSNLSAAVDARVPSSVFRDCEVPLDVLQTSVK